jgi:hypothetical protein
MPYDVVEKSITQLQAAMTNGEVTSEELVQAYLDRIQAYDQQGPAINAMVYINPNALADARALDEERAKSGARGPLHGIPAIIKDNFDTKDMPTTGGLVGLAGSIPTSARLADSPSAPMTCTGLPPEVPAALPPRRSPLISPPSSPAPTRAVRSAARRITTTSWDCGRLTAPPVGMESCPSVTAPTRPGRSPAA